MSLSFIENYENELRKETEKVRAEYENFKKESELRIKAIEDARAETRAIKENSEQFFSEIYANAEKLGLSDSQKEILFSTLVKF